MRSIAGTPIDGERRTHHRSREDGREGQRPGMVFHSLPADALVWD